MCIYVTGITKILQLPSMQLNILYNHSFNYYIHL